MGSGAWVDEGIVFYVYPSTASSSISHGVQKLYSLSGDRHYWTTDEAEKQSLIKNGFQSDGVTFRGFSGSIDVPVPEQNRDNIYRLRSPSGFFYTTNLSELEITINDMGYIYEGVLTTANASKQGAPIYRLRKPNGHFFTASEAERDSSISTYGMVSEGVGFYLDGQSKRIYRMLNTTTWQHLFTSNVSEVFDIVNKKGWTE